MLRFVKYMHLSSTTPIHALINTPRSGVKYPANLVKHSYTRALEERGLTEACFSSSSHKAFNLGGMYRRYLMDRYFFSLMFSLQRARLSFFCNCGELKRTGNTFFAVVTPPVSSLGCYDGKRKMRLARTLRRCST